METNKVGTYCAVKSNCIMHLGYTFIARWRTICRS
jgi:hypothetical protein